MNSLIVCVCISEILSVAASMYFPALLPNFQAEWALTHTEAGWISGIYFGGYAASVPILVSLTDRVDPRKIYLLSAGLGAVSLMGFGLLAQGTWTATVFRLLAGISFAGMDVYLNIAGGMRISEPAADLAVAAALISARQGKAMPPDSVCFGEISLSGALRPISQPDNRLKEAEKLGFSSAFAPSLMKTVGESGISVQKFDDITSFITSYFGHIDE